MKVLLVLVLCLFISSGCSSNKVPEQIVGNFLAVKMGGSLKGKKQPVEELNEMWTFTKDSLFIYKPCFIEKNRKKPGKNYKDTWYNYEENTYYVGDTLVIEIAIENEEFSIQYYLVESEITDEQKLLDQIKVDTSCIEGGLWSRGGEPVVQGRNIIMDDALNFTPIDTLDLSSNNSGNFSFNGAQLTYRLEEDKLVFDILFLHDWGAMRLIPRTQCQCENMYIDYFKIIE
ncbi:MAG: hypothetical protein HUJ25_01355 [Crocinitomicaceae bacterium]|nr:hypothetical protein [Crocinitomicaceae bacterium]